MYGSERVNARTSSRYIRTAMSVGVLFYWFIFYKQMHPTSANQPSPGQLWPGLASSSIPPDTPNKVPNWLALSKLLQAGSSWPTSAQSGKAVIWLLLFTNNPHSEKIGQTAPLQPSLGKLHSGSHSEETGQTMPDYSRKQVLYPNATSWQTISFQM